MELCMVEVSSERYNNMADANWIGYYMAGKYVHVHVDC